MKKIITALLVVVLCVGAVFALTACNNDDDLQFNEKYIAYNELSSSMKTIESYTFYKDGTGVYEHVSIMTDTNVQILDTTQYFDKFKYGYKVFFKYTYLDKDKSTVAAFYNSVSYNDDNTLDESIYIENSYYSDWSRILIVSKNVCLSQSGDTSYLREGFMKEIPNYDAK